MDEPVTMTPEERAEFLAFRAAKQRKAEEQKAKEDRDAYKTLVEESINMAFPKLKEISDRLVSEKADVLDLFKSAIKMKESIFGIKAEQKSHTFTNIEGTRRIIIGQYVSDDFRDTVNEGIAKVTSAIEGLARDDNSKALVRAVLKLLSKDQKGNLKASRVLQLRKMADESGNLDFIDGVKIIEESYQPIVSKIFIRCEAKEKDGAWELVPLGMTEA